MLPDPDAFATMALPSHLATLLVKLTIWYAKMRAIWSKGRGKLTKPELVKRFAQAVIYVKEDASTPSKRILQNRCCNHMVHVL